MNAKQLSILYRKEIMDVIRDKKTMFAMIVLPVILYPLIFLVSMQIVMMISENKQEMTYHVAYVDVAEEDMTFLQDFIEGKKDGYDYNIKRIDTDTPEKDLANEDIDAYITAKKTSSQIKYTIHYLSAVTNSSNVASMLQDEISALSKKQSEKHVKEAGLDVQTVLYPVASKLKDKSSKESSVGSILGGIIPFLLITSILMGAMYPAMDTTAGEKERGTLETLLTLPIGNTELIMSKFLAVATITVVSVFINVLSMGLVAGYLFATMKEVADAAGDFNVASFVPAILISLICVMAFALLMSAITMSICAFAKSSKEANNYITPLTLVVMFTGYIGFIPNIELTSKTALIPVANICLLIKNLLVFKFDFSCIFLVLMSNVCYAFIAIWFLGKVYNSENILFGESLAGVKIFEKRVNIKEGSVPSIFEAILLWIIALLLNVYIGGLVSAKVGLVPGLIVQQMFLVMIPLFAAWYIKADFKKLFRIKAPSIKQLFGAFILGVGATSFTIFISGVLSYFFPNQGARLNDGFTDLLDGVPFVGGLLLIALLPAICEELSFRGFMLGAFYPKMKLLPSMIAVSLIFGISHMSLIKLLPTALLGMFLAYAAYNTRCIFASSLMHFMNNAFVVFVLYYGDKVPALTEEELSTKLMILLIVMAALLIPVGMILLRNNEGKIKEKGE